MSNRFWLAVICLGVSCVKPMDESLRQDLMDQALERRLETYRLQKQSDCRRVVLAEAVAYVDSLLRVNPIKIELDTINRPPTPSRPIKPNFRLPKDTIQLKPLLAPAK